MPFVARDDNGNIIAMFREKTPEADEYLPPTNREVRAFIEVATEDGAPDAEFFRSDQSMIRVYEDLLDVLLDKKALLLTDLPTAAQRKLLDRKRLRNELTTIGEILSDESDGIL